jgi:GNAT superfamily N-acetyltransferase
VNNDRGERLAGGRLVTGEGDSALDQRLSDELDAFNVPAAGAGEQREFTVKAEDDHGVLIAGLSGWTWGTSAGIAMVWVREDARRDGWGSRLVEAAERVARERGCQRVHVSSFTFQAPAFYEKHGYEETGRTEALPLAGHADVHFVKHLR